MAPTKSPVDQLPRHASRRFPGTAPGAPGHVQGPGNHHGATVRGAPCRSVRSSPSAPRPRRVAGRVSGHSLRVGSAQSLAAAGAGLVELQEAGDWQAPTMPAHYARHQLAARGAVAKLRYQADRGARSRAAVSGLCLRPGVSAKRQRPLPKPDALEGRRGGRTNGASRLGQRATAGIGRLAGC